MRGLEASATEIKFSAIMPPTPITNRELPTIIAVRPWGILLSSSLSSS